MCVILVCTNRRPDKETLELCAEKNPQGAGVAWRDGDLVRWEKGLDMKPKDVAKRIADLKFPYIIHFRISSVGNISSELCHPFPFGAADRRLRGETKHGVSFHNGTWHMWKSELRDLCRYSGVRLPDGEWSDSRAMACLAGKYGASYLQMIDEKIAYLTPTECKIVGTLSQGWCLRDGIYFSNDLWEKKVVTSTTGRSDDSTTGRGTNPGPVVGGRHGTVVTTYNRGNGASPPTPWKKPAECGHDVSFHFIDGRRFCTACGIRLDSVKNEPWVAPATAVVATPAVDHTQSIAARVRRLCLTGGGDVLPTH